MNCCNNASTYTQMVASNGAYLLIDKPTRITNPLQTVIDHISTNDTTSIIHPIIFSSDITDHYPVACVGLLSNSRHEQKNKHCEQPIYYRDMSHFKKDDFAAELQRLMTEFLDTITLNTIDETEINFKNFVSVFKACIDKHATLKPASPKKRRLLTKPWITNEILYQIKQKTKTLRHALCPRYRRTKMYLQAIR